MPAIAKILIVFVGMLLAARLRLHLGLAMALGGVALSFWTGASAVQAIANLWAALHDRDLWLLLVITVLIEMCRFVTEGRNSRELLAAVQRWGGRHGRMAVLMGLPAIIGLIPMAAGAMLSAPFVKQASEDTGRAPAWQAAVNYWFRHIWEYWWPLYPAVIISISIFRLETLQFIGAQILYTVVAVCAGFVFLIRPHRVALAQAPPPQGGSNRRAFLVLLPLLVVAAAMTVLPKPLALALPGMHPQNRRLLAIMIGLGAGLGFIFADERRAQAQGAAGRMFSTLFQRNSLSLLGTVFGGLLFKAFLDRSALLPEAAHELMRSGIPLAATVAALPFLAGLVTGLTLGFAGTAFPLVVGLIAVPGSGLTPLAALVLAYGFGFCGMLLSPVHLCLLMTRDYFRADMFRIYRQIAPCVAVVMMYSIAAHVVLKLLGK